MIDSANIPHTNQITLGQDTIQLEWSPEFVSAAFRIITEAKNNIEELADREEAWEDVDKTAAIQISDSQRDNIVLRLLWIGLKEEVSIIIQAKSDQVELDV